MTGMALSDLAHLSDVLYQSERGKLQNLLEQESKLRSDLVRIDGMRQDSLALPTEDLSGLRRIGADVQWQAWLGRKRAGLNRELALVLAQKDRMMTKLRRAYGRKLAADQMLLNAVQKSRKARQFQDRSENQTLLILKEIQKRR